MLIVHLRSLHIITMPDKIGRCFFFHATTMKPHFSHAMAFWFTGLIPGCTYFSGKIWWFPYLQWTARSPGWRPKTIWNWSSWVVESSPGPSTVDSSWRKKGCRTLWILNWYFLQIVMLHFHQNITVQQMVSMTFSQFVGRLMLSQTSSVSVVNERRLVAMRVWVKFAYQASTKMHTLNGWKWGIPKSTWLLQNDVHPWRLDDLGLPPWLRKPKFKECGRFFGIRSLDQTKVFLENLVFFSSVESFSSKVSGRVDAKEAVAERSAKDPHCEPKSTNKVIFVYMQIYVFIFQIYYMHEYDMFYYNYMVYIYICIIMYIFNVY